MPSSMKHEGKRCRSPSQHPPWCAWVSLAVLVDAHIGIEICLSCGPPVGSNHPHWTVLSWSLAVPAEELLVREHHARQVQGLQMPFATDREHAHALQHVTAKVQPCQALLSCQSWRTDWLEAPRFSDQSGRKARISRGFRPSSRLFEQPSASIIIVMTSSRARDAPRRVPLTTNEQMA